MSKVKFHPWPPFFPTSQALKGMETLYASAVILSEQDLREFRESLKQAGRVSGNIVTAPEDARNKIRRMNHRLQELLHVGWGPQELRQVRRMLVDQNELLAEIAGIKPEPQQPHDFAQI